MRPASGPSRAVEPLARLPLAAQFVLALAALIVAGVAVAVGVMWYADYAQSHWTPHRAWVELAVFSAVTAAALIRAFKRRWGRPSFWVSFLGVMLVRTVLYVAVLRKFPDWPLALFGMVTMVETPARLLVLYRLNYRVPDAAA